jgi:uracil phosphoribosyltransferase
VLSSIRKIAEILQEEETSEILFSACTVKTPCADQKKHAVRKKRPELIKHPALH